MAFENSCHFWGRLGADPRVNATTTGDKAANFRIAVNERFGRDDQGNPKEVTTWVNCVAWRKLADVVEQFIHKGDPVGVSGRLRNRTWKDQEGNDRYTTEIVLDSLKLMPKNGTGGNGSAKVNDFPPPDPGDIPNINADDIPF